MKEYEYSLNVNSIDSYINYCKKHGYKEISISHQNCIVYENKNNKNLIARIITTNNNNGKDKVVLDFKNVQKSHKNLKESSESIPLFVNNINKKSILSMLEVMGFYIAANNTRTRYVYQKDYVIFEIDDYKEPKMQVVAIEGKKEDVDKVYLEVTKIK